LGIIGGIGPESTVVYYRSILAAGRERLGGASPPVLINSIDVRLVLRLAEHDPVPGLRDYLLSEINVLAHGGASLALIAASTPHIVFDDVRQRSPIPLVSIVEATRDAVKARGLSRVGLFGTRFTMHGRFYPDVFAREGIEVVAPTEEHQTYIHDKYVNELLNNVFSPATRDGLLRVVGTMKEHRGVQAVILGGTELPLILTDPAAAAVPLLDTTTIHVNAAVQQLWAHG
jgi:aspartate racemase